MNFDSEERSTIIIYIAFFVVIIGSVAFAGRFVLFRPWTARTHTGAVTLQNSIYLFGGRHRTGKPLKDILRADLKDNSLRSAGTLPEPLMMVSGTSDGSFIYLAGGYNGKTYSKTVYRYDPGSETCSPFAEFPQPLAFGDLCSNGKYLYYTGGWGGGEIRREILKIDTRNGEVTIAALLPEPLQYASTFVSGDVLYIIGGEDANGMVRSEVYTYNTENGYVSNLTEMPEPICRSSVAADERGAFLTGGWSKGLSKAIQYLRPENRGGLTALTVGWLPEPAADLASAVYNGNLYIVGGSDPKTKRQILILRYDPKSGQTENVLLKSFAWW